MNTKTYSFTKYIATTASVLIFTGPLIGFLQIFKNVFSTPGIGHAIALTFVLVGTLVIAIYIALRLWLKTKSPYTYEKKDNQKLVISIVAYSIGTLLAFIVVIFYVTSIGTNSKLVFAAWAIPLYVFVFAAMIIGAIYESLSRVNEQITIYQEREKLVNKEIARKRQQLVEEENIDREEIQKEVEIKRTSDAEKLLSKSSIKKPTVNKVIKPKQTKLDAEPTIKEVESVEKEYNPFMDQKLNDELKNDKKFDDWLNNKDKK